MSIPDTCLISSISGDSSYLRTLVKLVSLYSCLVVLFGIPAGYRISEYCPEFEETVKGEWGDVSLLRYHSRCTEA